MGYSPWGGRKSDTTEKLSMHACQEIEEDRGAWHAAVHGVARSQT